MNERDLSKNLCKDARVCKEGHKQLLKVFIQLILPKKTQSHRQPINMQTQLISPNAQPHSSEASLFVTDHTGVPPTEAQLLQEQHLENKNSQLFLDCPLPIWHKDTPCSERLLEEYMDEVH